MRSFSNFKQYIFSHLFPPYYKDNDTYKSTDPDGTNKGILERFVDICAEYFDSIKDGWDPNLPGLKNIWDILDIDKTPDIFLNYFWEYFGFLPYAYGVIVEGEEYSEENVSRWLNTPSGFPKADTRNILKYAISLYKIRCTSAFYEVLGRFYGVRFRLLDSTGNDLIVASYGGAATVVDLYGSTPIPGGYDTNGVKAGHTTNIDDPCLNCITVRLQVDIPDGMYDLVIGREEQLKSIFKQLINRYLPIWFKPLEEDRVILAPANITLVPMPV